MLNTLRACLVVLSLAGIAACSDGKDQPAAPAVETAEAPRAELGRDVVPLRYRLAFSIDPSLERFSGVTEIDIELSAATNTIWLHGKGLEVSALTATTADGSEVSASYEEVLASGVAKVSLAEPLAAGPASLRFEYSAAFNTSSNSLFRVERDGLFYIASQFQPIAARQAFPGFDEPGFKVPFDIEITARTDDVVVTTTPLVETTDLGDGMMRHVFETTRPLPTYLLAFAVGPYEVVDHGDIPPNSVRDRPLRLRAIVARGLADRVDYALENTAGILTVLEEYFGSPYPYRKLDLIAMPESFGGAMENVGAITYDEFLLIMDESSPIDQRRAYTSVHAHELSHMWFGNLVTPKWWTDLWLNESFATWAMYKASDVYWPEGEFDRETLKGALGAMNSDSLAAARQIRETIDDNDKIAGAFDGITYQKGGGVLAMLERYAGEDEFQAGVRLHMQRHADGVADADDFIASLAEGSDRREIEGAFRSFISQPGVPLLDVAVSCTEGASPEITLRQSRYAPLGSSIDADATRWQLPVCLNLGYADGAESSCSLLSDVEETIELAGDECPSWVHPNADGAGYYRFALDDAAWATLIAESAALPATEALVLVDSLDAAFRAGRISADNYVAGMAMLVNHPAWDVADAATGKLELILDIVPAAEQARVWPAFAAIAGPRFASLEGSSNIEDELLYQRLQRFMIVMARDAAIRAPLAERAAAFIGLDGEPDPAAVPPGQLETVLSVGVQDLGAPFFDKLVDAARNSADPQFRNAATGALARVEDPELVARLQDVLLSGDFKGTEFLGVVFRQMVRAATTEATYQWLRANEAVVINEIPETFRAQVLPSLGAFCSTQRATEWQAFIEERGDRLPGYQRPLAQTIESIELCAALRDDSAASLVSAFEGFENGR